MVGLLNTRSFRLYMFKILFQIDLFQKTSLLQHYKSVHLWVYIENYKRYLKGITQEERQKYKRLFITDIKQILKSISSKNYIDPKSTTSCMLLFILAVMPSAPQTPSLETYV